MIFIYCALYAEAAAIIEQLSLKKRIDIRAFQMFEDLQERYCLVLTGTGMINAASAVSYTFALRPPGPHDYLVNFGSCAAAEAAGDTGDLCICRKITDEGSGRDYYPDMVFDLALEEADLITVLKPVTGSYSYTPAPGAEDALMQAGRAAIIFDMEAAGVFQAANRFMGPHQMLYLKVISDHGEPESLTGAFLREVCGGISETVCRIILQLEDGCKEPSGQGNPVCRLYDEMKCTQAMREILGGYLLYFQAAHIDCREWFEKLRQEGALPCKSKREGSALLARMRKELIYPSEQIPATVEEAKSLEEKKDA